MKTSSAQGGTRDSTLRTKVLLLSAAAFTGILVVIVVSVLLLNETRIGGPSYKIIQENKDALESIAFLKSDLFQINSEMQNFMLETDKSVADRNVITTRNSQAQSSAMISKAAVNIQTATASSSEAAIVMESSISGLTRQTDLLEKEMSGFKI